MISAPFEAVGAFLRLGGDELRGAEENFIDERHTGAVACHSENCKQRLNSEEKAQ